MNSSALYRLACASIIFPLLLLAFTHCQRVPNPQPGELGKWVDPFIGTGGIPWASGMLFPGTTMPFGMVRLSPDTSMIRGISIENMGTAGYYYGHHFIFGFSHYRLSGTGATEGGQFRITPMVGTIDPEKRFSNPIFFDHWNEVAVPGYYAVWLREIDVLAELTATDHVGIHRYTFNPNDQAHLLIDATSFLVGGSASDGWIKILQGTQEVAGHARIFTAFSTRYGGLKGYFVAHFSQPFQSFGTWLNGELIEGRDEVIG